jgi:HEPN domain-containing protein
MAFAAHEIKYVSWQNRATEFYIASRHLHHLELHRASAYSAAMAIELLLKATLVYWVRGFSPEAASHGLAKLARRVRNRVPSADAFQVPEYFYFEQRYQTTSRYPKGGKGLGISGTMIPDLDILFIELLTLVPFQHNTEMKSMLRGRKRSALIALRRGNAQMRRLRRFLGVPAR